MFDTQTFYMNTWNDGASQVWADMFGTVAHWLSPRVQAVLFLFLFYISKVEFSIVTSETDNNIINYQYGYYLLT